MDSTGPLSQQPDTRSTDVKDTAARPRCRALFTSSTWAMGSRQVRRVGPRVKQDRIRVRGGEKTGVEERAWGEGIDIYPLAGVQR